MDKSNYQQALLAFGNYQAGKQTAQEALPGLTISPVSGGLINYTFKATDKTGTPFILQQINKQVFTQPRLVQENYLCLFEYAAIRDRGLRMPAPLYWSPASTLFTDDNDNYWRAFEFLDNTATFLTAASTAQAGETAAVFGKFTAAFDAFNTSMLKEVIPGFHNLAWRYTQFETAIETGIAERLSQSDTVINALRNRNRYKSYYEEIAGSGNYIRRVMHHDAKIANVLFDKETGNVVCPVDYDTVMPGYFFSDLGDMVRSMACSQGEDSSGKEMYIRKDYYDTIISRYCAELKNSLTEAERKNIHYAGIIMIYMQALRFLTDHLTGDTYYHIDYPGQNFERAQNQLDLLIQLENFLKLNYSFRN